MCQITTALHGYPKKHGLSIEWIADNIGVTASTLERYLNPNDKLPFPIKLIIPFMRSCNNDYSALDLLESRLGRVAFKLPQTDQKLATKDVVEMIRQFSDSIRLMADIIEDNKIDKQEDVQLGKHLIKLNQQINEMQARLMNKYQ